MTAPVVILARTQMGENIGTTARAMLNFGLEQLRLADPVCGWPNAKAVASASGANEVLNNLELHPSTAAAVGDLHHVFATTARGRDMRKPVLSAHEAALRMRDLTAQGRRVGLLFGPERTGLVNEELLLADALVSIPVNPAFASLNVGQAVLLLGYEWWSTADAMPPERDPNLAETPATKAEVRGAVEHFIRELEAVDYFRSPDRRESLGMAIQVMLERRQMRQPEIHLLRGIIKELVLGRRPRRPDGR